MGKVKDNIFQMEGILDESFKDSERIFEEVHKILYQLEYDYSQYKSYLDGLMIIKNDFQQLIKEIEIDLDGRLEIEKEEYYDD